MLLYEPETSEIIDMTLLEQICEEQCEGDVELVIVDSESIREINKTHRGQDKPTDVLSFPLQPMPGMPMGSIVICQEIAQEKADQLGHGLSDEISLLFIHGVLHLLGYDHECDSGEMREKESELIIHYGFPESLIVRSEKE